MSKRDEVEEIEIDLLLDGIHRCYGYDFHLYSKKTIKRRVLQFKEERARDYISDLMAPCLHDEDFFLDLLQHFSIAVTKMFRDPPIFRALREQVLPALARHGGIKVWSAGCATGEEAYSIAILLKEAGFLEHSMIYATDFNFEALSRAKKGIYQSERLRDFTKDYYECGGKEPFSSYFWVDEEFCRIDKELRKAVTFASHNLSTDMVFGEMQLILCRNVLIYFCSELRDRVIDLFTKSLCEGGFLCLGKSECLDSKYLGTEFEALDESTRIYRRICP